MLHSQTTKKLNPKLLDTKDGEHGGGGPIRQRLRARGWFSQAKRMRAVADCAQTGPSRAA